MAQSLSQIYIHCVFSTKNRKPVIVEKIRPELQAYIVGTLSKMGSYVDEIYVNPDHLHVLCNLPRTICTANFISKMKTSSSKWLKDKDIPDFSWQDGYGTFSVSPSKVEDVKKYVLNQPEHHKKVTFQNELRKFFKEYKIDYDERYVWD